ncbi:hypothetical protein [Aliiruegeria sabulilitoris]|uniref:hypothetical protein n=1 Tax=Aliiruegeria sabulilitoris TaxID=1510458 RepID=UPI000832A03A|nr:hypothetical protein [Aliiruegeria sabulilitoris]NDR55301.1 hypothetical protein [Pseudoruegeria sp. M32A2M]
MSRKTATANLNAVSAGSGTLNHDVMLSVLSGIAALQRLQWISEKQAKREIAERLRNASIQAMVDLLRDHPEEYRRAQDHIRWIAKVLREASFN